MISMEESNISDQVVRYVLTVADEEFSGLTASKLAYEFEVERCKLSRLFKKQMQMTLEAFLVRERMLRAAILLVAGNDTIKEVSRKVGYCTCDYFIKKFREYYGTVPGRFKEFKTQRSETGNRRSGEDRRQKNMKQRVPKTGDRRTVEDRRAGNIDRRNNHSANECTLEIDHRDRTQMVAAAPVVTFEPKSGHHWEVRTYASM